MAPVFGPIGARRGGDDGARGFWHRCPPMKPNQAPVVLLWLGRDPPAAADASGRLLSPRELEAHAQRGARARALLPAEQALALRLPPIPAHGEALLRAVLFAAEDALAEPVERFHVAFERRADGAIEAVFVPHALIEKAIERVRALGLEPASLTLDALLLPAREGEAIAVRVGERVLARLGVGLGHAFECSLWRALAPRLGLSGYAEEWDDLESWLAATARRPADRALELLTGVHAVAVPAARRALRRSLAALALVIVLALGGRAAELHALRAAQAELLTEAARLYRELSGDSTPPPDPLAMLEATILASGRGEAGAIPLLRRIAPLLAAGPSQRLSALEYREGALELVLTSSDVAALDLLRERLGSLPGLRVELLAAQPSATGVEGRLRVEERRP